MENRDYVRNFVKSKKVCVGNSSLSPVRLSCTFTVHFENNVSLYYFPIFFAFALIH